MNNSKIKSILISFIMVISLFAYNIYQQEGVEIVKSPGKNNLEGINNKIEPKISNLFYNTSWINATVISDGYNEDWGWNNDTSTFPDIFVDNTGVAHAVWVDGTNGVWGTDTEIMYAKYTVSTGWSNATVISDGYLGDWGWNNESSQNPAICVDTIGNIHVVWADDTNGIWGTDIEIMYSKFSIITGQWSNATVISDGYDGVWGWNNDESNLPDIAVDVSGNVHVVWHDDSNGTWHKDIPEFIWDSDWEIMYVNFSIETGQWSNVTIISDGFAGSFWNYGWSRYPKIAIDNNNNLHVIWHDSTNGKWRASVLDTEIMYVNYSSATGWSNITIISDGIGDSYWNNQLSLYSAIDVDENYNIYVVWEDFTAGIWGTDAEIMFTNYSVITGQWSNATVISDGYNGDWGWNKGASQNPAINVDIMGNIHIVWEDFTTGIWGTDAEIMYSNYSVITGQWSNVTVISDGYEGIWNWNNDNSLNPSISVGNSNNIFIIWDDDTNGVWGNDIEIMYSSNAKPIIPNVIYNTAFNISAPWDDAISANSFTNYTTTNLYLGGQDGEPTGLLNPQRRIVLRWNLTIPKNARILNAYINLTVAGTQSWNGGFTAIIQAFDNPNTPPFNNTAELIRTSRTRIPGAVQAPKWILPSTTPSLNSILKSPDISSVLQLVINNDIWINNSFFGVYIRPHANTNSPNEMLRTYAFDFGNPSYVPKLYVEWEESPYFTKVPMDLTIQNNTLGYYVGWTAKDNNPNNYIIIKNLIEVVSQGFWNSGVEIRYNFPKLGIGVYNYTLLIYDLDGNYDINSVTINCTNLDIPNITKIELIQNSEIFSINKRDYFICGDGPFTLKIYNNTPINLQIELSAYYKNYNNTLYVVSDALGAPTTIPVVLEPYTINTFTYNLNYSDSIDSYLFSPSTNDQYQWKIVASLGVLELLNEIVKKNISSIEYNVLNYFTFDINDGEEYIYNDTIYGGIWGNYWIEVLNKDLAPPNYGDPEVDKPNDSSSNFEVEISTYDEPYGSGIKKVALFYSVDNGPWKEIEMLLAEGKYRCGIPPQSEGAEIRYYIEISDLAGNYIETDEEKITAPKFENNPLINPIIGIAIGAIGALVIILSTKYYYNKKRSGASPKKFEKSSKKANKPTYNLWMLNEDD